MTAPPAAEYSIPLATAHAVAQRVAATLLATTTQAHIAGSVRRGKPACRDIDLVLCPRFDEDLGGGFAGWSRGFLAAVRDCPLWTLETALKPDSRKVTVRSRKDARLKIELWLATPWRVGWIYLLRTGPSDFTHELVTLAGMGLLTSAPGSIYKFTDGGLVCDGAPVRTPDEETVFAELGLPFLYLGSRSAAVLRELQREQAATRRAGA